MASEVEFQFTKEDLDKFVDVANKAADVAAKIVRKYYRKLNAITTFDKVDDSGCISEQTTNADIEAEAAIILVISKHFPEHAIYGEENGWTSEQNADYVWVIDPIDGTTSFKNGVPSFGILIALLYKSKPILGIIDQPILRDRWLGVHKRNTTLNGTSVRTRSCDQIARATLFSYHPLHFSDEESKAFGCVTGKVKELLYGAECYHYGRLASGLNDLIIQSFLGPYDFLALVPIIEGAGGVITDWKGQKLHWEASPSFRGPTYYSIIAAGDEQVHQQAIEYLSRSPAEQ